MGQGLEKPITDKDSGSGAPQGQHGLAWASTNMQGWRTGQEDAHICLPGLPSPWGSVAMFGVLDGHGGEQVAKFCETHLPQELHSRLNDARPWASGQLQAAAVPQGDLRQALTDSFHEMDELLRSGNFAKELKALTNPPCLQATRQMPTHAGPVDCNMVGCTCNITCITAEYYLCANAGDSRSVLCRGGQAVPLSEDHKPNAAEETRRIKAAGGYIETQTTAAGTMYRVNGNLNLSRALGDLEYKKDRSIGPEAQIICATPDFICEQRCAEDEFIVICCDGVWDVKSNEQVVDFVRARLPTTGKCSEAASVKIMEDLLDDCVSPDLRQTKGLGGDNMTAVLIHIPSATAAKASSKSNAQELQAASAQTDARLLGVEVQACGSGAGSIVVRIGFGDARPALRDVYLGLCEDTGELEVGLAGKPTPQKFPLQAHLKLQGARLCLSLDESAAKFFPKSNTLRATLQWRLAPSK